MSCLKCGFRFDCMKACAMAMRVFTNGIAIDKAVDFFEAKAAGCDAYTEPKTKRKKEAQFSFKF